MELSTSALAGFRTKYSAEFNSAYNLAKPQLDRVAISVNSGLNEFVNHRWMAAIPGMRKFQGARVFNNLGTNGFIVANEEWEDSVSIPRRDLERDQWGVYLPNMSRLGQLAALHRDLLGFSLLSDAIASATRANYKAYDGSAFFGAHTNGSSAFTNVQTSSYGALNVPNLAYAIAQLRKRKDAAGNPLEGAQTSKPLVIASPANEFALAQMANASFVVGVAPGNSGTQSTSNYGAATENVLKGTFDYITSPYIKTDAEWHVTLNNGYLRPLVRQTEVEVQIYGWDKFLHQWVTNGEFCFGAYARYNVALALPESIQSSTGS